MSVHVVFRRLKWGHCHGQITTPIGAIWRTPSTRSVLRRAAKRSRAEHGAEPR